MTAEGPSPSNRKSLHLSPKQGVLFVCVVAGWILIDQVTKAGFSSLVEGRSAGLILGGLIDLRLVHNTGAAWGIFAGNPAALGGFSLAVCLLLLVYFVWSYRSINSLQTLGIALVVAGGVGNAIDRFAQGYVTDFLAVTFMDFPVFNVADIGVTCGVVLLLAGLALAWYRDAKLPPSAESGQGGESKEVR